MTYRTLCTFDDRRELILMKASSNWKAMLYLADDAKGNIRPLTYNENHAPSNVVMIDDDSEILKELKKHKIIEEKLELEGKSVKMCRPDISGSVICKNIVYATLTTSTMEALGGLVAVKNG